MLYGIDIRSTTSVCWTLWIIDLFYFDSSSQLPPPQLYSTVVMEHRMAAQFLRIPFKSCQWDGFITGNRCSENWRQELWKLLHCIVCYTQKFCMKVTKCSVTWYRRNWTLCISLHYISETYSTKESEYNNL